MTAAIRKLPLAVPALSLALGLCFAAGCDTPSTTVSLDNAYPAAQSAAPSDNMVVYQAFWQAIAFTDAVLPGKTSGPQDTIPASDNPAYVLVAPNWDPAGDANALLPASLLVLQSREGFAVSTGGDLHIPVDDVHFAGNCQANSFLSQDQTDFITKRVFATLLAGRTYDAATCQLSGSQP